MQKAFAGLVLLFCAASATVVTTASVTAERCVEVQAEIDALADADAVATYLRTGVDEQTDNLDLFLCMGASHVQTNPLNNTEQGSLLLGDGWGSVLSDSSIPFWNIFQAWLGRQVWHGKVFQEDTNGRVHLLNIIDLTNTMSFAAEVRVEASLLDGSTAVILDYREDTTVGFLSKVVVSRVRDELREVVHQGVGTKIFIGRANLYSGSDKEDDTKWNTPSNFVFAANFMLDFRDVKQSLMPDYAAAYFD